MAEVTLRSRSAIVECLRPTKWGLVVARACLAMVAVCLPAETSHGLFPNALTCLGIESESLNIYGVYLCGLCEHGIPFGLSPKRFVSIVIFLPPIRTTFADIGHISYLYIATISKPYPVRDSQGHQKQISQYQNKTIPILNPSHSFSTIPKTNTRTATDCSHDC